MKQPDQFHFLAMFAGRFKARSNRLWAWIWCITALLVLTLKACDSPPAETEAAKILSNPSLNTPQDAAHVPDSAPFSLEFTLLNMHSGVDSARIHSVLSSEPGVYSFSIDVASGICRLRLDSMDRYREIFQAMRDAGLEMESTFTMSGPGVTCDIEPTDQALAAPKQNLVELNDSVHELRHTFNSASGKVRVLSIPNPACKACVNGQRMMNRIFADEFPETNELAGIIVWISINAWGALPEAQSLAREADHTRWTHFWDAEMLAGKLFKAPLKLNSDYPTAWDVYLIYAPGIHWSEGAPPPKPTFWMHQLSGETGAEPQRRLNERVFVNELRNLL